MNNNIEDLIKYRFNRSIETLNEVEHLKDIGYWNTAVNRLYYACYYAVSALMLKNSIKTQTHKGIRNMFGSHFIQTGLIPRELGRFFNDLFDKRHTGDNDDYITFDKEIIEDLLPQAKEFIYHIEKLIF